MKKVLSVFMVVIVTLVLVACNKREVKFDFNDGVLVVGMEADYAPFNWNESTSTDHNVLLSGQKNSYVDGYDVQVAKALAKALDLRLEIKQLSWGALENALIAGDIDVIIAGMSPTAKRKERISFTDAYYTSDHVVVVKDGGSFANITDLSGLKGARGVGQIETIYATLVDYVVANHQAVAKPVRDTVNQMVLDIKNNDADFMIVETPVALLHQAINPELKLLFREAGNIFNVSDEDRDVSVGVRKVDTELLTKLNEALAAITEAQRQTWMEEASTRAASKL